MPEKILIVDDDVDSLKLIGLMLQRQGYEVLAANAGEQGLAKAQAALPDLIILDVMMPDMNGLEVCRRLRENDDTADIPIIMFTAKTMIDDKVKGFEAGADDYLTKPTHPAELASRVKAILARSAANAGEADAPQSTSGTVIGVLGAKGGVGTSTVALNLAASQVAAGMSPTLVDLHLGQGSIGLMLGLQRQDRLERLLESDDLSPDVIRNACIDHATGLNVLATSYQTWNAPVPAEKLTAVVKALRPVGNPTVLDLGAGITEISRAALPQVDQLIVVLEPNPIALQLAQATITEAEKLLSGGKVSIVVVNRVKSTLQTPWHEIENSLGRDVRAIISPASDLTFRAMDQQTAMVMLEPDAVTTGQFRKLVNDLKSRIRSIAKS